MRQSPLGKHYRELIRHKKVVNKFLHINLRYKSDLLNILEKIKKVEDKYIEYPELPLKQEVIDELFQVSQVIENFREEKDILSENLARLPLG